MLVGNRVRDLHRSLDYVVAQHVISFKDDWTVTYKSELKNYKSFQKEWLVEIFFFLNAKKIFLVSEVFDVPTHRIRPEDVLADALTSKNQFLAAQYRVRSKKYLMVFV